MSDEFRCTCCGRPYRLLRSEEGGSPLCRPCQPHAGNPLQEVREHRAMWWDVLDRLEEMHRIQVDQFNKRIVDLGARLEERPVREVDRVINQEAFDEVRADMERAFHQRDNAYETILELLLVHRLDDTGKTCRCGQPAKSCDVATTLEDSRAMVRGWERKQIELFRGGQRHRLPPNHPAVLDQRVGADKGAIA